MTSQKLEYDSTLGGSVVLPNHVQTFRHAAANIDEIKSLLHEIRNPSSTKLVFQTLPKHMRRRAMSHHPNRLPRKYRSIHNSQMAKAGKPPQITKRPSRKYRRKPSNLLKDYIRRQRNHKWLETHIWHAKRFHMVPKWGYKLPYASCDKTYRACYRASAKHCLLQDISFYACIEIRAKLVDISDGFNAITSPKCGLRIGAKTYTSGRREGSLELFKSEQYPLHALGKVSFLWRPEETESDDKRTLWLFVHPSAYDEILQELIMVLHLKISNSENNQIEKSEEKDSKDTPQLQFMTKSFAYRQSPHYQNDSGCITLTELKDTMSRFRLTGPLSQAVLVQALRVKNFHDSEPENWFKQAMDKVINLKAHLAQADFWKNCEGVNSPGELLSNMVLGLNVEDPRIHRPTKRTKAVPGQTAPNLDVILNTEQNLHYSSLWSSDLRNTVCRSMMSVHEYCTEREKNSLVPGERCLFERKMQPVPLLLIQRPGSQDQRFKRLSYSCGWDVIIPSGYGMPVWLSLIMWGAKPGGLRELESVNRELGRDQFLPDSVSGLKESSERQFELRLKYFRKPPNKRCNFNKLAIRSPFKAPFSQLVRDWTSPDTADYFILRDRDILKQLNCAINQKKPLPTLPPSCLVQINLCMKTRGNPGDFAIICLPTTADFKRNLKRIKFEKNDPIHTEPLHKDSHENERKKLQSVHKRLLKRLRRRRVREKRRKQETCETSVKIQPANTAVLVMEQFKKMCELWLPENESHKSLRNQCTREVFGYVTRCEFSYIEATVTAVGYITVPGLQELTRIWKCSKGSDKLLLVRGAQSRHYRFASFKINCDV